LQLIENLKPFVPGDWLQRLLSAEARKIDAQQACILSAPDSALNGRRSAAALFDPLLDFVVINRGFGGTECATKVGPGSTNLV